MKEIEEQKFKTLIGKVIDAHIGNSQIRCIIDGVKDNQTLVVSDGQDLYDISPEDIIHVLKENDITNNISVTLPNKYEMVDHPTHYHPGDYEAIKVIKAWLGDEGCYNFCIANSIKYISRLGFKPDSGISKEGKLIEDIDKAIWYLEYAKECKLK